MGHAANRIYSGRFLNFYETDTGWEFVSRKKVPYMEGNHKPDAVIIVPLVVKNGKLKMVIGREWREPLKSWVLGLPAGLIDEGETAQTAAKRELKEETGLTPLTEWGFLYETPALLSSEGQTDEMVSTVYFACEGQITDKYLEDEEQIVSFTIDRDDARVLLDSGELMGKVVYGVLLDFVNTGFKWMFRNDEIGKVFGGM